MPYCLNHDRCHGHARARVGRRGHRADSSSAGRTPAWCRTRLSEELCRRWDWRNAQGRPKDMAARTLLLKLERCRPHPAASTAAAVVQRVAQSARAASWHDATEPIRGALRDLRPLAVSVVAPGSADLRLFNGLLARYHYLGHRNTVGENLRYLVARPHGPAGGAARCSVRRRGSARTATPSSAGIAPHGSATCRG